MDKFSTIPDVKAALLALFQARPGLAGVAIQRGIIDPPTLEMIEIFESDTERDYRALKPQPHGVREQINITIRVTAMSSAQVSLADAEDRMWAICDELDGAFRADIGLGDLLEWGKLQRGEQRFWRFDQFRGSVITITMTGQATFG